MVPSPLAAPQPSAPGAPPAPSPAASNSALDPAFPMLGTITEQTSQRLMMERRYDLDHDLFLRDHTLGNAPSASDPSLTGLAVIPFTFSMELVAQLAMRLSDRDRKSTRLNSRH